jgi:glutathione synthase/RimK-type ligase-like ATP-grasp enzyme
MTQAKIGLLTSSQLPQLIADEKPLLDALAAEGMTALPVVWDSSPDWSTFAGVLVRNPWDYFEQHHQFFNVLVEIHQRTKLFNDLSLMKWNLNKKYLLELAQKGIPIVPTFPISSREEFLRIAASHVSSAFVLKPFVSAGSYKTFLWDKGQPTDFLDAIDFRKEQFMLQPFLTEIRTAGEVSLIFIDGDYSHAIRKIPAQGDFRVQEDFGGTVQLFQPSEAQLKRALDVLKLLPIKPAYARIDFSWYEGEFCVMELELIEPELFFRFHPPAAEKLARAIRVELSIS